MPFGLDMLSSAGLMGFASSAQFSSPLPQFTNAYSVDPTHPTTYDLREAAKDDISNQNLQSTTAIGGSG